MRALRRRAIGCAAAAATGAVLLAAARRPGRRRARTRPPSGIASGTASRPARWVSSCSTTAASSTTAAVRPATTSRPRRRRRCRARSSSGGRSAPRVARRPPAPTAADVPPRASCSTFLRPRGVTNVELFGHSNFPASTDIPGLQAYRAMLDAYGLHAGGWHGDMSEANWDTRVTAAKILGADYIGSGGFPAPGIGSYANTLATVEALNRLGKRSVEAGLGPVYFHNHQEEFHEPVRRRRRAQAGDRHHHGAHRPALRGGRDRRQVVLGRARTTSPARRPRRSSTSRTTRRASSCSTSRTAPASRTRAASAPHVATGTGEIDFKPIFAAAANRVRYYHQEHDGGSLADGNVSLDATSRASARPSPARCSALPPTFNSVPANTPAASNVTPVTVSNTGDAAADHHERRDRRPARRRERLRRLPDRQPDLLRRRQLAAGSGRRDPERARHVRRQRGLQADARRTTRPSHG